MNSLPMPSNLPSDINVELLLPYYPLGKFKVALKGLHKRNTYNDIIETEIIDDDIMHVGVGRNSIYNSLPEYVFHPIDRFDNIPAYQEKERYQEEIDKQEEEMRKAYLFFAPIDVLLLHLRSEIREKINPLGSEDLVMQQIIGDNITEEQRQNRFIKQIIPFLPCCKYIRGNRTLITFMLRKIFMEEGLSLKPKKTTRQYSDEEPRYENRLDMTLGECYVGNTFSESVSYYDIYYWSDEECTDLFLKFIDEVELLRLFIKDFFFSVEEDVVFDIHHDEPPLRLADEVFYNYLNYNTNI